MPPSSKLSCLSRPYILSAVHDVAQRSLHQLVDPDTLLIRGIPANKHHLSGASQFTGATGMRFPNDPSSCFNIATTQLTGWAIRWVFSTPRKVSRGRAVLLIIDVHNHTTLRRSIVSKSRMQVFHKIFRRLSGRR